MRINTNIAALNSFNNLQRTDNALNRSLERLSSGLRINRASDDAAGLSISEKMRGQIRGLNQAVRNAQDGISLIQTAEGALNESHAILQRMRELAVQAANDTYTSADRQEMQREIDQLTTELNRIGNTTEFNTKKLLDGTTSALTSTDRLTTEVFMRGGLRVEDQFGQKAVGGGNFKLEIEADPGTAQIQKTDIMKVKHGVEQETVTNDNPGYAKAAFTDIDATSGSATFNFQIDGELYSLEWDGEAEGADNASGTQTMASFLNKELGALLTATGASGNVTWRDSEIADGQLVIVLDGNEVAGKSFDFWVSDITDVTGFTEDAVSNHEPTQEFVEGVSVDDASSLLLGDYSVDMSLLASAADTESVVTQFTEAEGNIIDPDSVALATGQNTNISLMLEVTDIDGDEITVRYDYHVLQSDGSYVSESGGTRTLTANDENEGVSFGDVEFANLNLTAAGTINIGDRAVINAWEHEVSDDKEQIALSRDGNDVLEYTFSSGGTNDTQEIKFYQLDEESGEWANSSFELTFEEDAWETGEWLLQFEDETGEIRTVENAAFFTIEMSEGIGSLASDNTSIFNIDRFWDQSGNFLVEDPQTIQLVQNDGSKASFTIFRDDTIQDVVDKINNAIGQGLGQAANAPANAQFAYYVSDPSSGGTYDTVEGTIVINSAVPGQRGEINFVGDEGVLNALSLTTIREAEETQFTIDVTNAHSGGVVESNVRVTGNMLVGVVHENVDVRFDPLADIAVKWETEITSQPKGDYSNPPNAFYFESQWATDAIDEKYATYVHLADNTAVFQIGANPLQDVSAAIGDMRASALGVDNIQVTDRESANRAITQVDRGIDRVSAERSKMGAIQNRLEHTIGNLQVAAENLTAAESRIRDLDMAAEMMVFTRNQIMMQAGTAMLAQANMKPQTVLQLLG